MAPHVQPQYYAAIIIGEALGDSGQTQAVELSIDNSRIAGYAFYEEGGSRSRCPHKFPSIPEGANHPPFEYSS